MTQEEIIQSELQKKFVFLDNKVKVRRTRRLTAELEYHDFYDVLNYAVKDLGFRILCTITGLDEGLSLSFIYHLAREDGIMLNLRFGVPKDTGIIKTITDIFHGADIYERELIDLLGAKVEGLPKGKRYPLSDDWPQDQFPLRKDWKNQSPKKEI